MGSISIDVMYDEYSSIVVLTNMTRFQECALRIQAPSIKHIFYEFVIQTWKNFYALYLNCK